MSPEHPRLHVTARSYPGLLSLEELRRGVAEGPGRELWRTLQGEVERRAALPPYDPSTPMPGRSAGVIERHENDYVLSEAALQRVTDAALAWLIAERPEYRDDALRQIEWMFDPEPWPEWRHPVNAERGVVADHRIGSHLGHLSIAYDWLYPALRPDQRAWLLAGIGERALQRVRDSRTRDAHWGNYNNWTGDIVGGMGAAGMALADEIEDADELVEAATAYQRTYLQTLGPDGEFNESPFYASSVLTAIRFFEALRYHRGRSGRRRGGPGAGAPRAAGALRPLVRLPRGVAAGHRAVRRLRSGGAAQRRADRDDRGAVRRPGAALVLPPPATGQRLPEPGAGAADPGGLRRGAEPAGRWPLAMAWDAYGKSVISRSDWDPAGSACLVSAKAAHGWEAMRARGETSSYHMDYDAGQVCIASGSEHLIVDLGSSGGYASWGERGRYYGKGTAGHNVLMLDGATTRELGDPVPEMTAADCDPARGAWSRFDLTGIYEGAVSVVRTLVHLLPGTVAVLDEAVLGEPHDVSLRWHTAHACTPEADGSFMVAGRDGDGGVPGGEPGRRGGRGRGAPPVPPAVRPRLLRREVRGRPPVRRGVAARRPGGAADAVLRGGRQAGGAGPLEGRRRRMVDLHQGRAGQRRARPGLAACDPRGRGRLARAACLVVPVQSTSSRYRIAGVRRAAVSGRR